MAGWRKSRLHTVRLAPACFSASWRHVADNWMMLRLLVYLHYERWHALCGM